jgi:hypothetical protein
VCSTSTYRRRVTYRISHRRIVIHRRNTEQRKQRDAGHRHFNKTAAQMRIAYSH